MNADEITPGLLEKEAAEKVDLADPLRDQVDGDHEPDATAAAWRVRKLAELSAKHAEQDAKAGTQAAAQRAEVARRQRVLHAPTHAWLDEIEDRAEQRGEAS